MREHGKNCFLPMFTTVVQTQPQCWVFELGKEREKRPLRKLLGDNNVPNEFAWGSLNPTFYILALIYRSFSLYSELKGDTVRGIFSRRMVLNNLIKY